MGLGGWKGDTGAWEGRSKEEEGDVQLVVNACMIIGVSTSVGVKWWLSDGGLAKKGGSEWCTYAEACTCASSARKALDGYSVSTLPMWFRFLGVVVYK